ncbi:replication initiation protein [Spirosoma endophyticum]|uniref:Initiator Replication protein n=1 Tax=Spirosoma endophyticum TaxID=662367 RepID=A0A1I2I889_9BACT|nr:replication initiation protein [Spirosoma endophyticum]SFF37790.1 Initiator Replication protein [Spirosoma endophyticum]
MTQLETFKQTNAITGARYDYTTTEKRLIYLSLIEVMKTVQNGIADDFFKRELILFIPESQLKKSDEHDHRYRDYRKAVVSLRKKDFSIDAPDGGWIETGFVNGGQYIKGKGLEVSISKYVLPYLYELTKRFTVLDATVVMTLTSKFSQRFYEWCCQWRSVGRFEYNPDSLKEVLCIKLPVGQLKRDVIEVAQAELMDMYEEGISDLYFTYSEERGGRGRGGSVKGWVFKIHTKKKEVAQERAKNEDVVFVMRFLGQIFGKDSPLLDQALEALKTHENVKLFAERADELQTSGKLDQTKNKPGYIRSILQKEFGLDKK